MRLQEKVVLISGAASGIGLAAAQVCAEEGAALVAPRGVGRLLAFLVSDDADLVRGSVFTR